MDSHFILELILNMINSDQLAQNMTKAHLCERCCTVPTEIRRRLIDLRKDCRRAKGGKDYWASSIRRLGIYLSAGRMMRPRRQDVAGISSTSSNERKEQRYYCTNDIG